MIANVMRGTAILAVLVALAACETVPDPPLEAEIQVTPAISAEQIVQTLDLAERALADERYDDTQRLLERVLQSDPDNTRAKLDAAELTLARGAFDNAAELFRSVIDRPEVAARAQQGLGLAFLLSDARGLAYEPLKLAVEMDPTLWRAWNGLGIYFDGETDWQAAEDSYQRAIDEYGRSAFVYNNLGYSLIMQGRYDKAMETLSTALRLDPTLKTAQNNLRMALAWDGKYALATTGVTENDKGQVYNNIGFVALMRRDYESAESYLLRAMQADPSFNQVARKNLALLRNLQDIQESGEAEDLPEALKDLPEALIPSQ